MGAFIALQLPLKSFMQILIKHQTYKRKALYASNSVLLILAYISYSLQNRNTKVILNPLALATNFFLPRTR